jgi:hypothetical protein
MTASLTIVVTCTDRKSLPVSRGLSLRNVPSASPSERARDWRKRLRLGTEVRPLASLYQGEQWKESLVLATVARGEGFKPRVVVASAGLGLVALESEAPSYSATFSLGKPDAVANNVEGAATWWDQLARPTQALTLASLRGRVLLVLSRNYAVAMGRDLARLGASDADVALVGGATEIPGITRIPSDASLRRKLGGTLGSLNQRMANHFLQLSYRPADWLSEDHLRRWNLWASESRHKEVFDRQRATDAEIKAWIRAMVADEPISASRALREYRWQGNACEQSRFGRLYREVVM